ncbi:UPF0565 protein C2orf69 homolog [Selaginella moellendorffii]|uniref:UPF0565 protein C2orf69 homolog n=1 Tax=Selaginella moellendorffii TaxID=88036 RepID=UPI000D1C7733|nr:UPF0565 protein C2orf69 homolog [Selaginella moellendorffii]|eukprot:XP_024544225.1 UPF0565 protein C2orf69 homolog [Selaginella moellendorffii]
MASEKRVSTVVSARAGSIVPSVFSDLALGTDGPCRDSQRLNAILFMGDRVKHIDCCLSPTVECLSKIRNVGPVIARKLGPRADVWVVEAPRFAWNSMACYDCFLPHLNPWGSPHSYDPRGLPAAATTISVLKDVASQVNGQLELSKGRKRMESRATSCLGKHRTIVMGFSKGGVVLNQLMAELAHLHGPDHKTRSEKEKEVELGEFASIPRTSEEFLDSIEQFHYIDVGMNECGAYTTDDSVLEEIAKVAKLRDSGLTVFMHGTPRQWSDSNRGWISAEKDQCIRQLREAGRKFAANGKLRVEEKTYFADEEPSLDMHFSILEAFDLSVPDL